MGYRTHTPTRALFGVGQLNYLHEQDHAGKKALLVIIRGKSVRRLPCPGSVMPY